jgi:iron(III) transport system substrate-binding protein
MMRFLGLFITLLMVSTVAFAQRQTVVVYNGGSSELIEDTVRAFNEVYPDIRVTVVSAGVGQLTTRVQAEAANPRGDILFGSSVEAFEAILDLFEPYQSSEDEHFDRQFVHPQYYYYGYSQPLQAFVINTRLMPLEEAPSSWADLADPTYKGKIIMANPSLSGSAYAQLAQVLQLHDWDLAERIIENATFTSSSQVVYQNVARGEIEIGITGESNIAQLISEGYEVAAVYPSEGTGLRFDAVGIIKGGPNPEAARTFLDFATSLRAHEVATQHFRRSVRADAPAPEGLAPTAEIPTFDYDPDLAAATREENLQRFDEIFTR